MLDGICAIKPEFIVHDHVRSLSVEHLSNRDKNELNPSDKDESNFKESEGGNKRRKVDKKLKGQNKQRGVTYREPLEKTFCPSLIGSVNRTSCDSNNCKYLHSAAEFLAAKPPDIGKTCYVYSTKGHCPRGITCRFGQSHLKETGENITDETIKMKWISDGEPSRVINSLSKDLQVSLWKRTYDFKKSSKALRKAEVFLKKSKEKNGDKVEENPSDNKDDSNHLGAIDDSDEIPLRKEEKKKIDWKGQLYLSPLTTVGNLPFRRVCVEYGADITCGEMALSQQLVKGTKEWTLVRRHSSEKVFGVQICGNSPMFMTKCGQLLQENAEIDFIDINMGCPIDALYEQGCGSGMLKRKNLVKTVVSSLTSFLDIPLTVKTRTGVSSSTPLAHEFMPMFREAGVSMATIHGRSREQRYTKNADWNYVEKCAQAAGDMPVFGNGDILSFEDYERCLSQNPSVAGVMIGRGALIKPWIFTEIKERRHLDLSSSERFEIIKKYVNYGLEYWGSDTRGVETTRRFLLEWLSFLCRYVPYGVLESPPQTINQRPPYYRGRDDLETLFASPNCKDWISISEMLLGPVPDGFTFLPKHKANAWK